MDTFDDRLDDEMPAADGDAPRQGDILGLGGAVRTTPEDHVEGSGMRPAARRRRMSAEERPERDTLSSEGGATGIDMGSGGTGTDIE